MTLAKWMDRLDEVCQTDLDMAIYDLPQDQFRDAYACGFSPEEFRAGHPVPFLTVVAARTPRRRSALSLVNQIPLAQPSRRLARISRYRPSGIRL